MRASILLRQRSLIAVTRKHHGLGNRVRVVLGGRSLARHEDRSFHYVWPTGRSFGARLDQLWQFEPAVPGLLSRGIALRYPYSDEQLDFLDGPTRGQRVVQIRTAHALHLPAASSPWDEELRGLRPVPVIADTVREFFVDRLEARPYVGVMIRSHANSHAATLRESPLQWYIDRMTAIRERRPEVAFFVSSDTEEVARDLSSRFDDCHSLSDKGPFNSTQALRSAVCDLYLLASAGHILGPHYSSFPEMAEKLAGGAIVLETSSTPPDRALDNSVPLTEAPDPLRPSQRE